MWSLTSVGFYNLDQKMWNISLVKWLFYCIVWLPRRFRESIEWRALVLGKIRALHHSLVYGVWFYNNGSRKGASLGKIPKSSSSFLTSLGTRGHWQYRGHLKMNDERMRKGLFTFACNYIWIDLCKGLLDNILLKHRSYQWIQPLDYENMTLSCCTCFQTRHLQGSCPQAKTPLKSKRGMPVKQKVDNLLIPFFSEDEEKEIKEDPPKHDDMIT